MKYAEYEKRCSDCFALVEGDHGEWWCDECNECCENVIDCPEGLSGTAKKYKVHVHVVMEADVYVYAENEDEARDIVDNGVYPIDYANETCGFEYDCDKVDEVDNITCDCNYMDIITVEEKEG